MVMSSCLTRVLVFPEGAKSEQQDLRRRGFRAGNQYRRAAGGDHALAFCYNSENVEIDDFFGLRLTLQAFSLKDHIACP